MKQVKKVELCNDCGRPKQNPNIRYCNMCNALNARRTALSRKDLKELQEYVDNKRRQIGVAIEIMAKKMEHKIPKKRMQI